MSQNKDIFRYMQLRVYFTQERRSEPDETSSNKICTIADALEGENVL